MIGTLAATVCLFSSSIWALALSGAIYQIDDSLSYSTVQWLIYHD